ncbi:MAG: hypothetical protein ABSC41_01370 [Acidimicrobiales bacterium]|jgi:hypothetical protein
MFRSSARVAAVAAMLAVSSLGSIAIASGVASASAPKASCTSGTLTTTGGGTIKGCTPTAATGGSGKIVASIAKKTGVITWNKTGTTLFKYTEKTVTNTKCTPKTDTEISETATVTGGTGAAVKTIAKGQVSTTLICLAGTKISLVKGEKYQI